MENNKLNDEIKALREFKKQIHELRKIYDLIEAGNLKNDVKETVIILDKIYKEVAINSNKIRKIQKIIDYYAITLQKILNRYITLKTNKIITNESEELYMKIEAFVPRVKTSFEKVYISLFSEEILDIDAEIEVMIKELGLKNKF